jgi:hypothetical protein
MKLTSMVLGAFFAFVFLAGANAQSPYVNSTPEQDAARRKAVIDEIYQRLGQAGAGQPSVSNAPETQYGSPGANPQGQMAAAICANPEGQCLGLKSACAAGTMNACYRAAACACQAAIAAGGCGMDIGGLQQCVSQNLASAEALHSNAPAIAPAPRYSPPPPPPPVARGGSPPSAGYGYRGCPQGRGTACGAF